MMRLYKRQIILIFINVIFINLLVLYSYAQSYTDQLDPAVFIGNIKKILEDPLPPLSEVLPGYTRPWDQVPSLVVTDLTSENEEVIPWGNAVGRILRRKIMFAPKILLRIPDVHVLRGDAWRYGMPEEDVLKSAESIGLIGQRLGIKNALTGHIAIEETRYVLRMNLIELPSMEVYKTFHYSGDVSELPETLSIAAIKVYESLGINLDQKSKQYLLRKTPEKFEEIKAFTQKLTEVKKKPKEEAFKIMEGFMKRGVFMPAAAALSLYYMKPDKDHHVYLQRLDDVASVFPDDAGIELTVADYMGYKNAPDLAKIKISRFQKIIRENPQDPSAMIKYADFLAAYGYTKEALVVCIETLERWPDQYRAWWNISYALLEYAWQLRGTEFWVDVPEKGKKMFPPLKDFAEQAVNKALEFNKDASNLWVLKMRTIADYSPELMESFFNAIRLSPDNRYAYEAAYNFSLPQWGGSYEAQEAVWNLAVKYNPGQEWLQEIRNKYMKEPPFTYKMRNFLSSLFKRKYDPKYFLIIIFIIPLSIAAFLFARKRKKN